MSQIGSMKTSPVPSPSVCLANASHHTRRPRSVQCCLVLSLSSAASLLFFLFRSASIPFDPHAHENIHVLCTLCPSNGHSRASDDHLAPVKFVGRCLFVVLKDSGVVAHVAVCVCGRNVCSTDVWAGLDRLPCSLFAMCLTPTSWTNNHRAPAAQSYPPPSPSQH